MSSKEKLLDSAQKNLKKKQVSKAISDYQKLVQLDPKDIRVRQKLAELLARSGKAEEALEEYEAIGKYYAENDFHLKAIAIYKQIQRMDATNARAFLRLAELNQKQGLLGNALAEYRQLISLYEGQGRTEEAVQILRKMRDLDPTNLNVRAKLVEISARSGQLKEAATEFQSIVETLRQQKAYDKVLKLYEMFLPVLPETAKLQSDLAQVLLEKGDLDKGIRLVQDLLRKTPSDSGLLLLLADGYRRQRDFGSARLTYQQLVRQEPKSLDLRQLYIECCLADGQYNTALTELEEWKESFLQAERLTVLKTFYERLREHLADNRRVLQTLDSIYALTGEGDKLLDIMQPDVGSLFSSAAPVPAASSADAFLADEDLLGSLEQEAAADLVTEIAPASGAAFDFGDLDLSEPSPVTEEISFDDVVEATPSSQVAEEDGFFDLELELEPELEEVQSPAPTAEEEAEVELFVSPEPEPADIELELTLEEPASMLEEPPLRLQPQPLPAAVAPAAPQGQDFQDLMTELEREEKPAAVRVEQQLDQDDIESHYNLGIAYKEMGLLDDAVAEFRKIKDAASRFVDSHTLLGVCLAEKERFAEAESAFRNGLTFPQLNDSQRFSLYFEMGLLYERMQRPLDALDSFQYVADYDPFFRGVKDRVNSLRQQLGLNDDAGGQRKDRVSYL